MHVSEDLLFNKPNGAYVEHEYGFQAFAPERAPISTKVLLLWCHLYMFSMSVAQVHNFSRVVSKLRLRIVVGENI
jgi:hypothetical protein